MALSVSALQLASFQEKAIYLFLGGGGGFSPGSIYFSKVLSFLPRSSSVLPNQIHAAQGVNSIGLKTVGRPFRCLLRRIFPVKSSWAPI